MPLSTNVYWSKCKWEDKHFYLAATERGLCYVGSPNASYNELEQWVEKRFKRATLTKNKEKLYKASHHIYQYLEGKCTQFSIPLHIIGTDFQRKVWRAMKMVPYGEVTTYSEIAQKIGNAKAVRAVGSAIGANPLMIVLPCHRVVAKNGSLAGFRGGLALKKTLLQLEQGVPSLNTD